VAFGHHQRTILAGMKQERSEPQAIVGVQALLIGFADGLTPALAVPERAVPNGARAG